MAKTAGRVRRTCPPRLGPAAGPVVQNQSGPSTPRRIALRAPSAVIGEPSRFQKTGGGRMRKGSRTRHVFSGWLVAAMLLFGCTGDKAKEMIETAEFEERQMNLPHAKQLYEDVIRLYPSSKEADIARTRLAALNRE